MSNDEENKEKHLESVEVPSSQAGLELGKLKGNITESRSITKTSKESLQSHLSQVQREKLKKEVLENKVEREQKVESFWDKILGEDSRVGDFLSDISNWVLDKVSFGEDKIELDELEAEINKEIEKVTQGTSDFELEEYLISHRTRGFGKYPDNSPEGMILAMDNDIDPEIDIRVYGDELYVCHDPLHLSSTPPRGAGKLNDFLKAFSDHKNKESVLNIDVKELSAMPILKRELVKFDIWDRCRFMSFNPDVLKNVREVFPSNQMFFHYIPMGTMSKEFSLIFNSINKDHALKICEGIDRLTDGKTALRENFSNVSIHVEEGYPPKTQIESDERAYFYSGLPCTEILDMIVDCNGYISIPLPLASEKLIAEAHNYRKQDGGVKVALWAVDDETQTAKAISMGADLIVSDRPNII